jgi:hypothetical protein
LGGRLPGYLSKPVRILREAHLIALAQHRRQKTFGKLSSRRGMARFEVYGRTTDRTLIRLLALRLAANDAAARQIRAAVTRAIASGQPTRGGILAVLRRSPLVGTKIRIERR